MRLFLALLLFMPLAAQESSKKPAETTPAAKSEAAPAEKTTDEKAAETPAPVVERWISGSVEVGYRWVQDARGNVNTYRSIVDLGSGPKLVGADLTFVDPSKKLFDTLDLSLHNWGGDPYNTLRVNARKQGIYNILADYRNMTYFNNLPSFANPLLVQGNLISQRAFDTQRRYANFGIDLLPGRWITPFFSYTRDAGTGSGITPFVAPGNEYAVPVSLDDRTNNYRGGVRLELKKFHLTLEQGGTTFEDGTSVSYNELNRGNRVQPIFGQNLFLNKLTQLYNINGDSIYSRVMATGAPTRWLNLYGQFLYSQPESDVTYNDNATGLFANVATLQFYTAQSNLVASAAKQPHTSGNVGFELRPVGRVRIVESLSTDRFHNASSALLTESLIANGSTTPVQASSLLRDRLNYNYNRNQIDGFVDVTSRLTLRGGFRTIWGDSQVRPGQLNPFVILESGELRQNVGIVGINYRMSQKLSFNADYENASSSKTYFRTSLRNYSHLRLRGRYQAMSSLLFTGSYNLLDNQNPTRGVQFDMRQQLTSLSVNWTPKAAKRISLIGDYTRSTFRSDLGFLDPIDLQPALSAYRENGHIATGLLDVNLPGMKEHTAKLSFGGSMFISAGSRPTSYYQPIGRFSIPLVKNVQWFGEWRWYGYSQSFYVYEGFRTNHFLTGFRVTL